MWGSSFGGREMIFMVELRSVAIADIAQSDAKMSRLSNEDFEGRMRGLVRWMI